jgi:hypothetical protein
LKVTRELVYERPTKRMVRFLDAERGTVHYFHNEDYEQLGRPDRIVMSIEPPPAEELAQAA